jgi:hypothetical protein
MERQHQLQLELFDLGRLLGVLTSEVFYFAL